jgi:Flp pilus assembly protein TadG
MKALLRVVLVINALIFLGFGGLFLLTPWVGLWNAMHLVNVQPVFVGQLFGIALIGLAWLAFHAAIDGALTATAAKVTGHVEWLSGLVMLVWLLGLRTPEVTGFGQIVAALIGVVMLVLGLGSVRLSGAVRRRDRAALAGAVAAERAEKRAAKARADERIAPVVTPASATATDPAARWSDPAAMPTSTARPGVAASVDPVTGQTIDPATGRAMDASVPRSFDPVTGHKIDPLSGRPIDPVTGRVIEPVPDLRDEPDVGGTGRRDPL